MKTLTTPKVKEPKTILLPKVPIDKLTKEECLELADNLVVSWILKTLNGNELSKKDNENHR